MPFCCHGYTKAVTQDLMDTFKAKSQKKGNRLRQQEEEEEDEEDKYFNIETVHLIP